VLYAARVASVICLCLLVMACADFMPFSKTSEPDIVVPTITKPTAERDQDPRDAPEVKTPEVALERQNEIILGSGTFVNSRAINDLRPKEGVEGDVTLNFVNADLREVLKAILSDTLQLNYTIDPKVQGAITLHSSRPLARDAVLPALEIVLKANGLALLQSEDVYQVVAASEGSRSLESVSYGRAGLNHLPGFGIQIVPLKFVTPVEVRKVLEPIVPQNSIIQTDVARNLLFIAGTARERESILNLIDIFDVDWLASTSFGIFLPKTVDAETLIGELELVFKNEANPMAGLVRLIPIPRINAVLAITPQPDTLASVEEWINRLDRIEGLPSQQLNIYSVQNTKASDLAESLGSILDPKGGAMETQSTTSPNTAPLETQMPFALPDRAPAQNTGPRVIESNGMRIAADENNNALLIWSTIEQYETVLQALKKLDVPPHQVLIEATVAEVSLNDNLKYGVQWFYGWDKNSVTFTDTTNGAIASRFPGFAFAHAGNSVKTALNALSAVTDVNVISSPKLMVLKNHTATLQVGDQVPVATQSAVSITNPGAPIVNTVQFKDTGVILTITPRINNSGMVLLDVTQEVSDVVPTTTSGIDSPTIRQRKISTTVTVSSGEMIALGGLIRNNRSKNKSGVPLLKDIPLFGAAFSSTDNIESRTELLVFMTPHIVRNMQEADDITEYLRHSLKNADNLRDKLQ